MKPSSYIICLLLAASLVADVARSAVTTVSPSETMQPGQKARRRPAMPHVEDDLLRRLCSEQRRGHSATMRRLPWCRHLLHVAKRRRRGVPTPTPTPPPGRVDGEEIDARYGVSKRLVPTGPNPLHH